MSENERRVNPQLIENDLYKVNINRALKSERRESNIEKMRDIQQQKAVWKVTFGFCILLNILLISMGLIGSFYNG